MKEWPLVIFTVAIQLACGLALAALLFEPLAIAVFPVAALGILVSLAHLGRPAKAWRAFINLRRSPLSREVLATSVFALLALASTGSSLLALRLLTSAAGIIAVLAAATVYAPPDRPAWKSFLAAALIMGIMVAGTSIPEFPLPLRALALAAVICAVAISRARLLARRHPF